MAGRFGLLPHARTAIASQTARSGVRLTSSFEVRVLGDGTVQGAPVPMPVSLRGPGDVTGIAAAQIIRWEPEPGQRGFEPSYFPFVEFMDVDLPWRFSLTIGNPARLSPWLALLALADDEVQTLDQGRAPLPRILVKSAARSLPDPAQAWATAHVQVNMDDAGSRSAAQMLADDPGNGFSRLLCARRLAPRTRYQLFVVPLYEAGRLAGLGQTVAPDVADTFAWTFGSNASVELPYYAHSELTTDDGANVEQLLRKLRAFRADADDEPGAPQRALADRTRYYPDNTGPSRSFEIQTALVQADHSPEGYNTDPALAQAMAATLTEVIAGEGADADDDPLVAFPPYGFRFRLETGVQPARAAQGRWFDRVNLDLKMRHAAALGARVVEENQDTFMQYAWDQYDSLQEANQALRQLGLAHDLAQRLSAKHLAKLPPDIVTVLAEPLQPYVALDKRDGGLTIADTLATHGSPAAYASIGLRRLASKRPVRVAADNAPGAARGAGCVVPAPAMKGNRDAPDAAKGLAPAASPFIRDGKLTDEVAGLFIKRFGPEVQVQRPMQHGFKVTAFSAATFAAAAVRTVELLPRLKADFLIRGLSEPEAQVPAPVWRSPRIPVPLADRLTAVARGAILSGIGDLPDNTVAIFAENRAFIEAFMVGANHAMNDELRWREFPTDMRGTIFDRFWNRAAAPDDTASADIAPIHSWVSSLGSNPNPANPDGNPALVIAIKGDIVRKLGLPHIVINESAAAQWAPGQGTDYEAAFFGKTSRDLMYVGFDLPNARVLQNPGHFRLVMFEPMGRLRFGLDVGSAKVRHERLALGARSLPFAMQHRSIDKRLMPPAPALAIRPPAAPALTDWDQLSWEHMTISASDYVDFRSTLAPLAGADLWGTGKTSASLARSFWQKPLAGVVPFTRILP